MGGPRRGRPRIDPAEDRAFGIAFRLTTSEYRALQAAARARGLRPNAMARALVVGNTMPGKSTPGVDFDAKLERVLELLGDREGKR